MEICEVCFRWVKSIVCISNITWWMKCRTCKCRDYTHILLQPIFPVYFPYVQNHARQQPILWPTIWATKAFARGDGATENESAPGTLTLKSCSVRVLTETRLNSCKKNLKFFALFLLDSTGLYFWYMSDLACGFTELVKELTLYLQLAIYSWYIFFDFYYFFGVFYSL